MGLDYTTKMSYRWSDIERAFIYFGNMVMSGNQKIVFPFDERKTLAVAQHLLKRLGNKTNYMYLLKLIFFADRYHIRKYLRPATGDRYFAMHFGSVASYLYDLFKGQVTSPIIVPIGNFTVELREEDASLEKELSPSDIEAIDFSMSNFASRGEFDLSKISHAYPEWKRRNEEGKLVLNDMSYLDFFDNPDLNDPNLAPLSNQDPFQEDLSSVENSKEVFKANKDLEKLWY